MGSKWMLYVGLNFFNSSQVNIIKKLLKAWDQKGTASSLYHKENI